MKVVLQRDVANVGRKFDVAEVPNGYALNKLIPSGAAVAATAASIKSIEMKRAKVAEEVKERDEQFAKALEILATTPLTITVEANENGQLFQALKTTQVADAAQALGAEIAVESIVIEEPIKSIGAHEVVMMLGDQKSNVTITVEAA